MKTIETRIGSLGRVSAWALVVAITAAAPARAIELSRGDVELNIDSTLSFGTIWRTAEQDQDLIANNPTGNEGNKNYKRGPVASTIKGTHEIALGYKSVGAFVRFSEYHDFLNADRKKSATNLTPEVRDEIGKDIELFDAYAHGTFNIGERALSMKLGNQVVNWGEALFFQGGIASANGFDLRNLRQPGSEIKEAMLPTPMAWLSLGLLKGMNVEGFYNTQFKKTQLEASGTFFSTNDTLGDPSVEGITTPVGTATRGADVLAKDGGEYGVSLKYMLPFLTGTELGFYYTNTHNRTPILSARATPLLAPPFLPTVQYYAEYPENIKMAGIGLNTDVKGLGLQFEYAHRYNNPTQLAGADVFTNAIGPALPPGPPFFGSFSATDVHGYTDLKTGQFDLQLVKDFASANPFFADNAQFLVEAALSRLWSEPGAGLAALESNASGLAPTKTAWGYQARLQISYYSLLGPVGVTPTISFAHDVDGVSPAGGNFLEGRKSLGGTLTFNYLNSVALDVGYTANFGASSLNNTDADRDFSNVTLKYYF
ncbi:MAG: DUF1302 domain-containing protein [Elusimicrobia bacterium]|nr:DUF1302 domain-containing protein [Elusimicrobiota bacterium]